MNLSRPDDVIHGSPPQRAAPDHRNVLLTCAGRRTLLAESFREALGGEGLLYGADMALEASALRVTDRSVLVPAVFDPDYIDCLLQICRQERIGLLVPLNDFELPLLAAARDRFTAIGTVVMVSSPEVVEVCKDKWLTSEFLRMAQFDAPATYRSIDGAAAALESGRISFPLVIKPRCGSASVGVEMVHDLDELEATWFLGRRRLRRSIFSHMHTAGQELIIQECLGPVEMGLEIINTFSGRTVGVMARRKLGMRAGETDRAVTVDDPRLTELGWRVGEALQHDGILDCDVMVGADRIVILEMNARFGGGYPFSQAAGADVPAALIAWAFGRPAREAWLHCAPGLSACKADRLFPAEIPQTAALVR
jgi:carbamoyl-phosphate synthase large subunit